MMVTRSCVCRPLENSHEHRGEADSTLLFCHEVFLSWMWTPESEVHMCGAHGSYIAVMHKHRLHVWFTSMVQKGGSQPAGAHT